MSRPFSQTMQTHELDGHRLWLVLLLLASVLLIIWAGWASTRSIVVYENSSSVRVTEQTARHQTMEEEGNVYRPRTFQQLWLEASFAETARGKLQPGQQAQVFLRGQASQQRSPRRNPAGIPAVITEVREEKGQGTIVAVLRAELPEEEGDLFAQAAPERVQVTVDTVAPISLMLSGRTSASQKKQEP